MTHSSDDLVANKSSHVSEGSRDESRALAKKQLVIGLDQRSDV